MIRFRAPVALLSLFAIALIALGACSPFGGGDDDDADNPGSRAPTATRDVIISIFTPTEVVPSDEQTATAETRATDAAAAQATRANLPTPTPATDIDPEDLLWPPRTRLETPAALVESYLSTYSWQFSDEEETYASVEAPITALVAGDPAGVANGDQLAIRYYGDEYRTPPQQIEVAIYDFESNNAVPIGPTGEQGDEPGFAIRTEPLQILRVDPASPTFTLNGFEPGHYIIWTQGRWGQHPALDRQIFVTWVFDIEITG